MAQQGQVFPLEAKGRDGTRWAYRYRVGRARLDGGCSAAASPPSRTRRRRSSGRSSSCGVSRVCASRRRWPSSSTCTSPSMRASRRRPRSCAGCSAKAVRVFGERRLSELRSPEIAAWRMTIPPGHRFEATQALRQVLARAVGWGMLDVNPAKLGVENPQRRRTEKRPFESWEELDARRRQLGPRHGPMVIFAAATGLRPGEWLALEHRDIDRDARVVYVRRTLRNGRIKMPEDEGERARRSAAGDRARRARRATARPGRARSVFPAERGGYLDLHNFRNRNWKPAQKRRRDRAASAGLRSPAHLRDLRAPCRHLHLRPLPLHGRQPDHDRPPLRPPRPRRPRARDQAARHLRAPNNVDVHAGGRSVDAERRDRVNARQRKQRAKQE